MVKIFDGSLVPAVKHALVRGSGGMPPGKCWKLGSLRVHLLAIHISVSQAQINRLCSQTSITAHKLCHQDCQTCTKSNSSWPTRCGI